MFSGVLSHLPQFQTRKALIILDLQNDFVSPNGKLPVSNASGFIESIKTLAAAFRPVGDVVWTRTEFQQSRPTRDPDTDSVIIVLDPVRSGATTPIQSSPSSPTQGRRRKSSSGKQKPRPSQRIRPDLEAFLSIPSREAFLSPPSLNDGGCCTPNSLGAQFAHSLRTAINYDTDMILVKSDYSAFNGTSLLLSLRMKIVTELYLAGSISNVSVYATALDAVRHGFAVTILEDCVGYRSEARHTEAMRLMADFLGASGITSGELMEELSGQRVPEARSTEPFVRFRGSATSVEIEADIGGLALAPRHSVQSAESFQSTSSLQAPPSYQSSIHTIEDNDSPERQYTELESYVTTTTLHRSGDQTVTARRAPSYGDSDRVDQRMSAMSMLSDVTNQSEERLGENRLKLNRIRMRRTKHTSKESKHSSVQSAENGYVADEQRRPGSIAESTNHRVSTTSLTDSISEVGRAMSTSSRKRSPSSGDNRPRGPKRIEIVPLGPGDVIGEGDSRVIYNLLPVPAGGEGKLFCTLKKEVVWQKMYHQTGEVPRLVAVQGQVEADGTIPIYRHPADESPPLLPFSQAVQNIKSAVEKAINHPLNHVLIQLYRDGTDNISEHADKTLDIVRGSNIVNVSLGAQRAMTLRTKKVSKWAGPKSMNTGLTDGLFDESQYSEETSRLTQRVVMPHNSVFVLGERTNQRWLHSIKADKRPDFMKTAQEKAYGGERISLTFRHIGTFLNPNSKKIWGQGARSKSRATAGTILEGDKGEVDRMIIAFGKENHETNFDWDGQYGSGFDVVNFVTKPLQQAESTLHLSGDRIVDGRLLLYLKRKGVQFKSIEAAPRNPTSALTQLDLPRYVDAADPSIEVAGDFAILIYLEKTIDPQPITSTARILTCVNQAENLLQLWRRIQMSQPSDADDATSQDLATSLNLWENYAAQSSSGFIAADRFTIGDSSFFPVLHDLMNSWQAFDGVRYPALRRYREWIESGASCR
jgi:nicotinamidase-related amidase/glutathione S-transferase